MYKFLWLFKMSRSYMKYICNYDRSIVSFRNPQGKRIWAIPVRESLQNPQSPLIIPCCLTERLFAEGNSPTITPSPNSKRQTLLWKQGPTPRPPLSDREDEERGNSGCLLNPTRNNQNEERDNIFLDIFARRFLVGKGYALPQSGEAQKSLVVPRAPSLFISPSFLHWYG